MGGPGAGSIYRLPAGQADIGSGAAAARAHLGRPAMPPLALRLSVDGRGGCQVAAYHGVQATLDGEPLAAAAQWLPGQLIAVGGTLLGLAPYRAAGRGPAPVGGRPASTSTVRRGCCRPSGSPGSSCRRRRPRPTAGRCRS